jgi:hypothetical protein
MSLYNAVMGFNPACVLLLPMIGKSREDFPRFRDCFAGNPETRTIQVFTRTGGGNREAYEEENDAITQIEGFLKDWDDDFDSTFAYWEFAVPEIWHSDFDKVVSGNLGNVSDAYKDLIRDACPKLKDKLDALSEAEKGGA